MFTIKLKWECEVCGAYHEIDEDGWDNGEADVEYWAKSFVSSADSHRRSCIADLVLSAMEKREKEDLRE